MKYDIVKYENPPGNFYMRFAFSLHKCGSSLMNGLIRDVCSESKIPNVNIPGPMFQNGFLEKDWQVDKELLNLFKEGYLYHSFRGFPPVLKGNIDFSLSRSVLLLRDPRDALVSQYFSFKPGGSHVLPKVNAGNVLKKGVINADLTIDEYVLKHAKQHLNKLKTYLGVLDFDNTKVFKYEDIYFDKYHFIKEIFEYFGFEVSDEVLVRAAKSRDVRPVKEDATKHIRKGTPGDYKEKLKQDTIEKLNEMFSSTSFQFGYDLRS